MLAAQPGITPTGRRSFNNDYRREFLREWDACHERGQKTALLRENNLSYATVRKWISARDNGRLDATMRSRSRKGSNKDRLDASDRAEIVRLREENEKLKKKVAQAEAAQDIMGKAYELLEGITTSSQPETTSIPPSLMSADEYAKWLKQYGLR